MARDFERRLARAETAAHALGGVDAQAGRRRCSLRALVAVCDIVRERLVAMRLDPELAVALRRGEEAGAEPAGMPDTRELRASEAAVTGPNSSGARDGLHTKMARIADSMRRGLVAARSRLTSGMPRSSSCLHSFRLSVRSPKLQEPRPGCCMGFEPHARHPVLEREVHCRPFTDPHPTAARRDSLRYSFPCTGLGVTLLPSPCPRELGVINGLAVLIRQRQGPRLSLVYTL